MYSKTSKPSSDEIIILFLGGVVSPRVLLQAETLQSHGFSVEVVCLSSPGEETLLSDYSLHITYFPVRRPGTGPRTVLDLWRIHRTLKNYLKQRHPLAIHCTHLALLPIGISIANRLGAKVVYDAFEFYPEMWSLQYLPFWRSGFRSLMRKLENHWARKVDAILTIDSRDNWFAHNFQRYNASVLVLYNVPKKNIQLNPERCRQYKERYAPYRVIAHIGGVFASQSLVSALQSLQEVKKTIPNIKLLLIGSDLDLAANLEPQLNALHIADAVEFLPWMAYEDVLYYLAISEIGLALQKPVIQAGLVSRGNGRKFFAYMQSGLPIIAPDVGEVGRLVQEEGCGMLVDTTNPFKIAEAIIDLLSDPERRTQLREAGKRAISLRYCWENESQRLLDFYHQHVGEPCCKRQNGDLVAERA